MHVAVFNDGAQLNLLRRLTEIGPELDLMLLEHFLDLYHHLPIFTVCIHGLCVCLSDILLD
jgi:hypothetical protein